MSLDIELFRVEKGGNPEEIRRSQQARFKSVAIVDEVIALDKEWRKGLFLQSFFLRIDRELFPLFCSKS
jgi:seryl-tRNA synthetase